MLRTQRPTPEALGGRSRGESAMRLPVRFTPLYSFLIFGFLFVFACSRGPTPEEQRADEMLEKGRQAVTQHRYQEGRGFLLEALAFDANSKRVQQAAEESELLGEISTATAQYDSAFLLYEQSHNWYKSLGEKNAARRLKLTVAYLHHWIGEEEAGFALYSEMMRIARALGDIQGLTEIEWAMLPSCRVLDRRELETSLLTELLNRSTAEKETGLQAKVYYEWGLSHAYHGEDQSAIENFLRAITLADQGQDSLLAISALAHLAMTYHREGNTQEAFQTYTDGLMRADKSSGAGELRREMLVRVGNIYLENRQFAEAERFYRPALLSAMDSGDRLMEGYLLIQLGHCSLGTVGGIESALKNYQSALDLFSSYSYEPGSIYALMSMGIAASGAGRLNDALGYFTSAVEQHDSAHLLREENDLTAECEEVFLKRYQTSPHEALVEVLLSVGKYDEAFLQAERQKGEKLYDALGEFMFDTGDQQTTSALKDFQHQKSLHAGAMRQLGQMLSGNSQDRLLLEQLRANLAKYKGTEDLAADRVVALDNGLMPVVRRGSITLAEVQRALAPGAVLVEPVPTSRSLYLFAVANPKWSVQLAAVEKSRYASLALQYNQLLLQQSDYPDSTALQSREMARRVELLGASLYDALIRPVEDQIAGATRLIIVPPDELVPFHSLQKAGLRRGSPYLIQRYPVEYLPSAATMLLPVWQGGHVSGIVGVGHPGTTEWDVEYELRDIRAFSKEAQLYFQKQATLATLQKEHGALLHLAAEFHYDDRSPGNSYVLLSDGQAATTTTFVPWGALLSVPRFSAIILSDLGRHETIPSAKPALFLMGGSETVILTMYPAHRKTKKYFGEMFYTSYLNGNSVQESYRQAMLGMIENSEYAAPHLWAPFFLYGR